MAKNDSLSAFLQIEWKRMRDSVKLLDKRFFWIILLEIAVILSVVLTYYGWLMAASTLNPMMDKVLGNIKSANGAIINNQLIANNLVLLSGQDAATSVIVKRLLIYAALAAIIGLALVSFLKWIIYRIAFQTRWSVRSYAKFYVTTIVWLPVMYVIFILLQRPIFMLLAPTLATSFASQVWFIFDIGLIFLLLWYLTLGLFASVLMLEKTWQALKLFWKNMLSRFWLGMPAVFIALAIFMAFNGVLYIFRWFPGKFTFVILAAVAMAVFVGWARLYLSSVVADMLNAQRARVSQPVPMGHAKR